MNEDTIRQLRVRTAINTNNQEVVGGGKTENDEEEKKNARKHTNRKQGMQKK
jgi:hypothetical protein